MKKVLLVIACLTTLYVHADSISDAIREYDLETMNNLLQHKNCTATDYAKYIATAVEAIKMSRDQILMNKANPQMSNPFYGALYLASIVGALCPIFLNAQHTYLAPEHILVASCIGMMIALIGGFKDHSEHLEKCYNNALKMYDLLIDSSLNMQNKTTPSSNTKKKAQPSYLFVNKAI